MSAYKSPRLPSASASYSRTTSMPPPPTLEPRTPKRDRTADLASSKVFSTPQSKGASVRRKEDPYTGQTVKYDSDKYINYIAEDFRRHRVFIGMDSFMETVLRVPEDWETQWGPTIEGIKTSELFKPLYETYTGLCDTLGGREDKFYEPLVDMVNTILQITSKSSLECVQPLIHQRYIVNDPKTLTCGLLDQHGLSPDIVAVHQKLVVPLKEDEAGNPEPEKGKVEKSEPKGKAGNSGPVNGRVRKSSLRKGKIEKPLPEAKVEKPPLKDKVPPPKEDVVEKLLPELDAEKPRLNKANLTWAQPLQILEMKPYDTALVNGMCMPRLRRKGRDPLDEHVESPPSRYQTRSVEDPQNPTSTTTKKRPADGSRDADPKVPKQHGASTPGLTSVQSQAQASSHKSPRIRETIRQQLIYHQIGKYLLEEFSIPAYRSHATVGLVDRDRIQFYHANRSVILVSSAICFGKGDNRGGLDKLIAIVIAFSRLSLQDNGILHDLTGGGPFKQNNMLLTSNLLPRVEDIQEDRTLTFPGVGKSGPFTLKYGKLISREPSLVGRSTVVLHATSPEREGTKLVVKINWPNSTRVSESVFLKKAIKEAEATPNQWALKHLPGLVFDRDIEFGPDSIHEKVTHLFGEPDFISGGYDYEDRVLRIIVQERLHPLLELTDVKEIAQVILDVACIHRWLCEKVGILHRDLSPNNIMFRIIDGIVYGVLTDFDLSSWTAALAGDYTRTSQQRTGTPPYMAYRLLDGTDPLHRYRHDVESLFYILLILATHYKIEAPGQDGKKGGLRMRGELCELPNGGWFNQPSYSALANDKLAFFTRLKPIELSPAFEDFGDWIEDLRFSLHHGAIAETNHNTSILEQARRNGRPGTGRVIPPFDEETLGGNVCYSSLVDPARHLSGKLKGLIVRYESKL